jgi:SAM-dependent methyltransferase
VSLPASPEAGDREWLLAVRGVFKDEAEQQRYISDGWTRMHAVLDLLADLQGQGVRRVLELGSNPYVLTLMLRKRFQFDLELANYLGPSLSGPRHTHVAQRGAERVDFDFAHFNIETDRFPYADGQFDCVLFCEILEHLLLDPARAVSEMARIVRPGGFIIVTTPNVTRLANLYFLALGRNIYDGYSANGPYGRHNREYTLAEVTSLLARHGFETWRTEVRNIQPLARRFTSLQWLRPTVWYEHLFVVGRRSTD